MVDPVITLSLGVVLSIIGITITLLIIVIGSWMNLQKKIDKSKKEDELFQQEIETNIKQFHENGKKQQSLCESHQLKLTQICGEIKVQNESNKYMIALFEDMKRLNISTASAIHGVTTALGKLEVVMQQILSQK